MALCQDVGKGRGRKLIVEKCKGLTWKTCVSKLVYSNVSETGVWGQSPQPPMAMGVWGQSPQPLGDFCKFLEKKLFKSHWITFRTSSEPFQRTRFLTFQCQSKKFSCSILFLQLNPKTRLESCIMV